MNGAEAREALARSWRAGVAAAHGETLLRRHSRLDGEHWHIELPGREWSMRLPAPGTGRLRLVGAGKAAASLARGAEAALGERIDAGLVVVKHGHAEPLQRCRLLEAGHPLPDAASGQAAQAVLEFVANGTPQDLCLVLLTGGASALLAAPAPGLTLADKIAVNQLLLRSGASIQQMNVVRRHLSRIKGGQLARALHPARSLTLAISDVLGDEPAVIGSGPTVADPSTFEDALGVLRHFELAARVPAAVLAHLVAGARGAQAETAKPGDPPLAAAQFGILAALPDALDAAARAGRDAGFVVERLDEMDGDTHARARAFAARLRAAAGSRAPHAPPLMLVAGGETTLRVRGTGQGGRCQEFSTVVAQEIAGAAGLQVLAAGTDGTDGPTDAAGAWADGGTIARARAAGLDADARLRANDTHPLLAATGDLFVTGPTGTNVMDLVLGIAYTAQGSPERTALP